MRKIIHSIGLALILSVVLVLIFPTCFLRGDAGWTYLGDTARVDVAFAGNIKKGRVKVQGVNTRIFQPKWLSSSSENSFQGAVVEFPVSYRKKAYQIKLTPQADEWGKDAALVIKFRGEDFKHEGKRRPAWVSFQNITLNGQQVAAEKDVCHDQPLLLKYSRCASEITLTFDVHKPLTTADIAFANLFVTFFVCLMLNLFFPSLKAAADHVITFIDRKDIVRVLSSGYTHIDPVYRRSFWIIFGILCFVFGFHTICYMWGNHDWSLLEHSQRWLSHAWNGRYMVSSVKVLLFKGVYLPLIHDLIIFILLALNAVLLCRYWRLEKRVTYFVLCGLVLTAQPFTLSMMYYVNMTPEVFIGVTCALAALVLSESVAYRGGGLIGKLACSLIAIVLVNLSLAMYPVLITTIAVAFVGRLLVQAFDWDGAWGKLRSYTALFMVSSINIVLGIALYKLITTFVFPIRAFYNTDTLPLDRVPERLGVLLRQCFHQLYEYNMPFLPQWILWIFLGFTLILTLYICSTGMLRQKIVRLSLLFGSLFATQTAMIIAKVHLIDGRVELFGLVFFQVLVMTLIITRIRQLRNPSVIIVACIALISVIHDLDCLRVWKLGFDAEKMLWNRVLARLEIQKDFSPEKKYNIVQIGKPFALRTRFYTGSWKEFHDHAHNLLTFSYDHCRSNVFGPFEFYYPTRFRGAKRFSFFQKNNPEYEVQLRLLYQAGVLQKAEVWPKANGLIVWKNTILFVTDGKELENYKKQFKREVEEMKKRETLSPRVLRS